MKFKLIYKGPVKINPKRRTQHITDIRSVFSVQLENLFKVTPYKTLNKFLSKDVKGSLVKSVAGVDFISLISPELAMLAELDIQLLVPELARTPRADIDNRMKTLLDALRRPQDTHEVSEEAKKQKLFYTLLDDDKYVSKLLINTTHLLENPSTPDEILVVITVNLRATSVTNENIHFII